MRKGISPVIATVIIVAVAIAISIAVAGWLFGLWGGLASGTAQIQVSTVSLNKSGSLSIYIVNTGSGSDTLLKVEVSDGTSTYTVSTFTVDANAQNIEGTGPVTIGANGKGWISADVGHTFNAGQSVTVTLYFEKSGTVTVPVTVKA